MQMTLFTHFNYLWGKVPELKCVRNDISAFQTKHFGTINNLGKSIYFAFALRKQLTNDN